MITYPNGAPMKEADIALLEQGDALTTALMAFIGSRTDANDNMDVRVLAIALGNVLGCYVYGVQDKEHRIRLACHFCETFFQCAQLSLRVEVVS